MSFAKKGRPRADDRVRFEEKFRITPSCWIWTAGTSDKKYGVFWTVENHYVRAHRYSFELYIRPIPEGLFVCHRCDNPSCVNPDHLFLGTHRVNMDDMIRKGRNNGPRGELARSAKLTAKQATMIFSDTRRISEIAAEYNVGPGQVRRIKKGERWAHLWGNRNRG